MNMHLSDDSTLGEELLETLLAPTEARIPMVATMGPIWVGQVIFAVFADCTLSTNLRASTI